MEYNMKYVINSQFNYMYTLYSTWWTHVKFSDYVAIDVNVLEFTEL